MAKFTSRADLLIAAGESIKMQMNAGVNEPVVKFDGEISACNELNYNNHHHYEYEFPIAVVEGKPVFVGDELYLDDGRKLRVIGEKDTGNVLILDAGQEWRCYPNKDFVSWNPPKPKTVMVELLREDAEHLVAVEEYFSSTRVAAACRKALDKA